MMAAAGFPRSPFVVEGVAARGGFSCGFGRGARPSESVRAGGPYESQEHKGTESLGIRVGSGGVGY